MKVQTSLLDAGVFFPQYSERVILLPEYQDERSASLKEVDFEAVDFLPCSAGVGVGISGTDRLIDLKISGRILYGASVFMGLWLNYCNLEQQNLGQQSTLMRLYREKRINSMDFFGDVFLTPADDKFVLWLFYCRAEEKWFWGYGWLSCKYIEGRLSVVSKIEHRPDT